jgi:hypothetical protein
VFLRNVGHGVINQKTEIWIFTVVKYMSRTSNVNVEISSDTPRKMLVERWDKVCTKFWMGKPEGRWFRVTFRRRHTPLTKMWGKGKEQIPHSRGRVRNFEFHKRHQISWIREWPSASEKRTLLLSECLYMYTKAVFYACLFYAFLFQYSLPIYTTSQFVNTFSWFICVLLNIFPYGTIILFSISYLRPLFQKHN